VRVLITGAAGRLGRKLSGALGGEHELVLGDVNPPDDPRAMPLDVTDLAAVRASVAGCEGIVHMAIVDWPLPSLEETLRYGATALQVHVAGTYNVLQAALEAGLRRVVHLSSASAVDGLPEGTAVPPDCRHYSNGPYGLTKGLAEDVCRAFHAAYGVPVTILRLGTIYSPEPGGVWIGNQFVREGADQPPPPPGPTSSRVHVDDVTRAIAMALAVVEPEYALVHIVGASAGDTWDLEAARRVLGWAPRVGFDEAGLPRLA